VPVIHDRFEGQGPLAGIHAALEWAGSRPVFVTACDLPNISAELVDHVAGLGGRSPAVGSQNKEPKAHPKARVAVWNSRQQPLFGLYSESCREPIAARLHDGRLEAWRFLAEIDTTPVPITPELELYRPDLLLNVNSRADLQPRTPERAREPSRQR
jgi:molybdopterin-guanine dinucleotide biosynthesis protein A